MAESMSLQKAKERVKQRDDHQCRFCGVTSEQHKQEHGRGLDAHHIVKSADGGKNSVQNLITVCRDCHTTLENTQADALSRIKEEHTQEVKESYEEEIDELEGLLEKRERDHRAEIKLLENRIESEKEKTEQVFAWFDQHKIELHVLLNGFIEPDITLYKDREEAAEAYAECDTSARLQSKQLNFAEIAAESLKYTSTGNVDISASEMQEGGRFETVESADATGYMSNDIPDELKS